MDFVVESNLDLSFLTPTATRTTTRSTKKTTRSTRTTRTTRTRTTIRVRVTVAVLLVTMAIDGDGDSDGDGDGDGAPVCAGSCGLEQLGLSLAKSANPRESPTQRRRQDGLERKVDVSSSQGATHAKTSGSDKEVLPSAETTCCGVNNTGHLLSRRTIG